jgi:hypothetical protein
MARITSPHNLSVMELDTAEMSGTVTQPEPLEELPYRVELWHMDGTAAVERVLARALNLHLARAIFKAATDEHPDRRITLREGTRLIADSTS